MMGFESGCQMADRLLGLPSVRCCGSCHDDTSDGAESVFEREIPGAGEGKHSVCCAIATAIDERTTTPASKGEG